MSTPHDPPEVARQMEARTNRALLRFFLIVGALLFLAVVVISASTLYISFHNRQENKRLLTCTIEKEDQFRSDVARLIQPPHPPIPDHDSLKCVR